MARIARLVVPGLPHHVIQRRNRRGQTFVEEGDYGLYLDSLADSSERARCAVLAYITIHHPRLLKTPSITSTTV